MTARLRKLRRNQLLLLILALILPLLVLVVLRATNDRSSAAAASFEAESAVLSGAVSAVVDTLASGGTYLRFGL